MADAPAVDVKIKKGNCFGRCPVFELAITADGQMDYRGKLFVEKTGHWKGQLPAAQLKEMHAMIAAAELADLEEQYLSGATDMAMHILEVNSSTGLQVIRGDFSLPKQVKTIIAHVDSIGNMGQWRQYEAQVPREAVAGELLVKLKKDDLTTLLESFAEEGLILKSRIAPNMSMYVLNFPVDYENPGRLLVRVREHPNVEIAQFNQEVSNRN